MTTLEQYIKQFEEDYQPDPVWIQHILMDWQNEKNAQPKIIEGLNKIMIEQQEKIKKLNDELSEERHLIHLYEKWFNLHNFHDILDEVQT